MHILDENVRQVDPDERAALGELRAGNVEAAVEWYSDQQRIVVAPTREGALDQTVAAWAADVGSGQDTAMLAWRRANVAALNARARTVMADTGRLTGAELVVEGVGYRAGDRIVTLAPTTNGEIVTSQRGVVTSVDVDTRSLTAIMDDGRGHHLGADDIAPDRLAHGYATTVHRSQGATVDTAHVFADGGGRELGYVAMSRARQASHVHVVADNPGQAVEDLARDWSVERRQSWAIDTGRPDPDPRGPLAVEADPERVKGLLPMFLVEFRADSWLVDPSRYGDVRSNRCRVEEPFGVRLVDGVEHGLASGADGAPVAGVHLGGMQQAHGRVVLNDSLDQDQRGSRRR